MPAEKRSHDEMEQASKHSPPPAEATGDSPASKPAAEATATAGMLGLPFMLPNAALMAMNSMQQGDHAVVAASGDEAAAVAALHQTAAALAAATTANNEASEQKGEISAQQQQQLVQQQLQLLQMQQQHLQQMSPGDLSAVATMAHQMALGMVMMPMMPLMMMNNNGNGATGSQSGQSSPQDGHASPERSSGEMGGESLTDASGMPLMAAAAFGMGNDDTPKRKRGRPPKKDVLALGRTKPDGTPLKQFPLWGYGMPLPFLPGFMPPTGGAAGDQAGVLATDDAGSRDGDDDGSRHGKGSAKKKTRGTGKPRGRPRTRPRPGDIIRRVKPPAIAPANFPGMQEYLVQKMAEWKATQGGGTGSAGSSVVPSASGADDGRVSSYGATLLPGDHHE